jgi:hypothetical protein
VFSAPHEHLQALLRVLDLLIHREILRLRATYQLSLDEFRGLYISDAQVDALIAEHADDAHAADAAALTLEARQVWDECREHVRPQFPWARVCRAFDLDDFEAGILLVALAPDVHRKYETLYAYLNDDVSRRAPTVDLASRVLSSVPLERNELRRRLRPGARLFRERLLVPGQTGSDFAIAPPLAGFLLELDDPPAVPATGWAAVRVPDRLVKALQALTPQVPIVVLESDDANLAASVAGAVCHGWGVPLEAVDASVEGVPAAIEQLAVSRRLHRSGLLLLRTKRLFQPADAAAREELQRTCDILCRTRGPIFVHIAPGHTWRNTPLGLLRHVSFPLPEPDFDMRRELWREALADAGETVDARVLTETAGRFRLSASRIHSAVRHAADMRDVEAPGGPIGQARMFAAARAFSEGGLGALARKVPLVNTWDDLVLPAVTLEQLHEVAAAARNRELVYSTWGLGGRNPGAGGVKVLFSGQSGTGKTMSAGVIARELGLDLYQIDLSRIVSKYIGETEKNLDAVFSAARGSNAVLFFDEADALFGKRSEVKDAHDRYANIEVGYLLQKMDEYEGIAVLATNLGRNIDAAFTRRLQYVVDLPLPDEALRLRLWRNMFTPDTPLGDDVNFALLARQYRFSGGEIRNVALAAAFLAASNGQVITMHVLTRAVAREMVRQGRLASLADLHAGARSLSPDAARAHT